MFWNCAFWATGRQGAGRRCQRRDGGRNLAVSSSFNRLTKSFKSSPEAVQLVSAAVVSSDTSPERFSPLGPVGIFQIYPEPISVGKVQTLAMFKEI